MNTKTLMLIGAAVLALLVLRKPCTCGGAAQ